MIDKFIAKYEKKKRRFYKYELLQLLKLLNEKGSNIENNDCLCSQPARDELADRIYNILKNDEKDDGE